MGQNIVWQKSRPSGKWATGREDTARSVKNSQRTLRWVEKNAWYGGMREANRASSWHTKEWFIPMSSPENEILEAY
jgi:hypothetical protein